eukprot:Gb_31896 [translate_table: standard]
MNFTMGRTYGHFLLASICMCFLLIVVNGDEVVTGRYPFEAQEADRVHNLPGQPEVKFVHYSGYITVNESHGRALFYWFFEAESQPSEKPLVLWLNGGPGCSSIGYGAAQELGPFLVKTNGTGLYLNKYSWNREANMLFLESPVGVGFSYTNTSSDLHTLNDKFTGDLSTLLSFPWLKKRLTNLFLDIKNEPFLQLGMHMNSLSNGSRDFQRHYVPQLAELIYDRSKSNRKKHFINLKGFIVGNPETDDYYDWKGIVDFAWSHGVISDQTHRQINKLCNFREYNWTDACENAVNIIFDQYDLIDIYNIYAPRCLQNKSSGGVRATDRSYSKSNPRNKASRRRLRSLYFAGYDPCYEIYSNEYFNRHDVQKALHANVTGIPFPWDVCSDSILNEYDTSIFSILPVYRKLIKAGLRIWVYKFVSHHTSYIVFIHNGFLTAGHNGDVDGRIPVLGTRYCLNSLHLRVKQNWHPWFHNKQVAGWFVEYHGLTYLTFRGAGHLVPKNQPSQALAMISAYLKNKGLRTQR